MDKSIKKGFWGILLFFVGMIISSNVFAKVYTVQELKDYMVSRADEENKEAVRTGIVIDETNKKIDFYLDDENPTVSLLTLSYGDDYVELDRSSVTVDQTNESAIIAGDFILTFFSQYFYYMCGYENFDLDDNDELDTSLDSTYDTYGIKSTIANYHYSSDDAEISTDYFKYYKLSLDSTKVDALYAAYGEEIDDVLDVDDTLDAVDPVADDTNNNAKKSNNPGTGLSIPIIGFIILLVASIVGLIFSNKKKVIRKI